MTQYPSPKGQMVNTPLPLRSRLVRTSILSQNQLNQLLKTLSPSFKVMGFLLVLIVSSGLSYAQNSSKREWDTPAWTDTLKNPMKNFSWAADSGKVLYTLYCTPCHGKSGRGDGVAAAGLTIKPADHTSDLVQKQADGSLYYEITTGHPPMPSFQAALSDKKRWELVCYIRTLKRKK